MRKKKFYKNKNISKRKGGMIVNAVLLCSISVIVVSLVFTVCGRIADGNYSGDDSSLMSDDLLTYASEELTESATDLPTELPTEEPKELTWNFELNGHEIDLAGMYETSYGVDLFDGSNPPESFLDHKEAGGYYYWRNLTYGLTSKDTLVVTVPESCRIAFTMQSGEYKNLYECYELLPGTYSISYPAYAYEYGEEYLTVSIIVGPYSYGEYHS